MPMRVPTLRRPAGVVNLVLALLIVGGGWWAYATIRGEPTAEASGVRTIAVRQGTVTKTVTASGSVASASTASATFGTSGTVSKIAVTVGQKVKKGQALAKVDPAAARRALDTAKANRQSAADALDRAKDAGSDTTEAENQVVEADLAVEQAQATLDSTTLTAPMAGTVVAVNGTLGGSSGGSSASTGSGSDPGGATQQNGQATTSSTEGSGFIDIADLAKLEITAQVAEADATSLKTGQQATVTWNALQGAAATGKVKAIDPKATTTNNVVTYGVTVAITKLPVGAKPGQTVTVSVVTGTVDNVLQVNSAAVRGTGSRHTVTVLVNGQQQTRQVEVGLQGDSTYEITAGLQVGEQVVIPQNTTSTGGGQGGLPGGGGFTGGGLPGGGGPPGGQRGGGPGR